MENFDKAKTISEGAIAKSFQGYNSLVLSLSRNYPKTLTKSPFPWSQRIEVRVTDIIPSILPLGRIPAFS